MMSENSQSTGPTLSGSSANALSPRHSTPGIAAMRGSSGALSIAITLGAELGQHPGPAAGRGAEIEAALARLRPAAQPHQRLPELEIGAVGRTGLVLDELRPRRWETATMQRAAASSRSGASRVHEPSGAVGAAAGKTIGLAETCGSRSWISAARR